MSSVSVVFSFSGLQVLNIHDVVDTGASILIAGVQALLLFRKNSTPLPSPSAPSHGSTHLHKRWEVQIALRKPRIPFLVLER